MKNHFHYSFLFGLLLTFPLFSQPAPLTLEEAILGPYMQFRTENLSQSSWRPATHEYTWVKDTALVSIDAGTSADLRTLLTLSDLKRMMTEVFKEKSCSLTHFPQVHWYDMNTLLISAQKIRILVNVPDKKIIRSFELPVYAANIDFCASRPAIAYTHGNNLVITTSDITELYVTEEKDPGLVSGQSVSRNEFGISKGTFWSPTGKYLAYYTKDERKVADYPLVNITTRIATLKMIRYPMAGMASEQISLHIFNLDTKKITDLQVSGDSDQYLTNISWGPEEKYIYIAILNRDQNHLWFNKYNVTSGKLEKTLFEERHDAYVEPLHPARFLTDHPEQFIWQSRRNGFNQVFLYNSDGKLIQNLTPEHADVDGVVGFADHDRYFAYISTVVSPVERHLLILDRQTGKRKNITPEHGMHRITKSDDGMFFADNYSNLEIPRVVNLVDRKGRGIRNLLTAGNPWKDKKLGKVELGVIPGSGNQPDLYYRLIKPVDFDPARKYPVIIYVYGGPHSQLVTDSWLGQSRMWQHYMAGQGYVSFTLDNRGTEGRGFFFENVIHRHLGQLEVADQMRGVIFLKTLPFVDTTRLGVHGWSYGGFMTLSMMLKNPGVFHVAVAGGPVTDWKYYEVMYGERYMDRPEQNPAGYAEADLKNDVNHLRGKCLIINGAMDSTVVWQHSLTLLHAFIKAGKQVDYFVYPGHPHNVRGIDRVHLMRKVSDYFDTWLKEVPKH